MPASPVGKRQSIAGAGEGDTVPNEPQYETIIVEKERGRARITLNRPEKLNALSRQLQRELREALWEADRDTRIHCVILRGAGRSFCAGYDLTPERRLEGETGEADEYGQVYRQSQTFDDDVWRMEDAQRDRMTIFDMHKPVIGQIHGYVVAGGTDLVFLCDIVVADKDARIGFPPVRAQGGPPQHMWTYHVGPQWAKYMLLTGEFISGEQAERIGLVWKAVDGDQLTETVEELADRMAMIHPDFLSGNKRSVNMALEMMGARTMQRFAAEQDARMHTSPAMEDWRTRNREQGLKEALAWRDGRFANLDARRAWQQDAWSEGPRTS
ncbi:MAG: crotonase/enoyl-CoA hydratase family protein [Dehalococcoidia bacterium]|nr:crotonase/enoyl-CoA hydratase family protein [Dehalococcoidia bacterium]